MANGSGLTGNSSSSQSGVIIKQPGNANIYFVFSVPAAGTGNLAYSIVDMSLAAGLGSVTVKNTPLFSPSAEKLTAARHCNGSDIWIIGHEQGSNRFHSYLLTSAGLSSTAVTSAIGSSYAGFNYAGYLRTSPSGKKLAVAVYAKCLELFDFDNATGSISNPLLLNNYPWIYGCEFSPDGSKLYASSGFTTSPGLIYQYDLCAGSASGIITSETVVGSSAPLKGALQLAPNGKIYAIRYGESQLGVINQPNLAGSACNYADQGQSIAPKTCLYGLPNYLTSTFNSDPTPFTYTISTSLGCQTASFSSTYNPSLINLACSSIGYSLTGLHWNFGDPASGSANTSTLQNPVHAFTALGIYTVQLILYNSCGNGADTLKQIVNINCISVNSSSISCASPGTATVQALGGIGPFSYTWIPSAQTSSIAGGLSPGTYTIRVFDAGSNSTYSATTSFTPPNPLSGSVQMTSSVNCHGASTGTGVVTNVVGGTGQQHYLWTNGIVTFTSAFTNSLSAGEWTVVVTDAISNCQFEVISYVTEPPPISMSLSSSSAYACAGKNIVLSGTVTGGVPSALNPNYDYNWSSGATASTHTITQSAPGLYTYTLNARDSVNCLIRDTISLHFIPLPIASLSASPAIGCVPYRSEINVVNNSSNSIKWKWQINGVGFTTSNFDYYFNKPGSYVFTGYLTDTLSGCTNTVSSGFSAFEHPHADFLFEPKNPVEGMEPVTFSNTSLGNQLASQWHFIDNTGFTSNDKHTSYYFGQGGAYPVALVVTDAQGCSDSVVKVVNVNYEYAFYIPNAFTPNNDNRNDIFMPVLKSVKLYEMMVYDRWGRRLFFTNDQEAAWDGTNNGEPSPQGVYSWKIKLSNLDGEEKTYSGHVFLTR